MWCLDEQGRVSVLYLLLDGSRECWHSHRPELFVVKFKDQLNVFDMVLSIESISESGEARSGGDGTPRGTSTFVQITGLWTFIAAEKRKGKSITVVCSQRRMVLVGGVGV